MSEIIEFPAGTDKQTIEEQEHLHKKEMIRRSLGLSQEKFDRIFQEIKEFFELNKKTILRA